MHKLIAVFMALSVLLGAFFIFIPTTEESMTDAPTAATERDVTPTPLTIPQGPISLTYLTGPDGYVVDDMMSQVSETMAADGVVGLYRIMGATAAAELAASVDAREGPPAMHLLVMRNDRNQSASQWVESFPQYSNSGLAIGTIDRDAVVGGANAVSYTADGLYPSDNIVVANGDYMYHFSGAYLTPGSVLQQDFQALIDTIEFIPPARTTDIPINVTAPTPGARVSSPVVIEGQASGVWFFEATAPVTVVDWDGRIIGEGYIEATTDWMTEDLVPFRGEVTYTLPPESYSRAGTVIVKRANASGVPTHDAAAEVSVVFE